MDNKDVEGAIEWITNLVSKLADGVTAVLNVTPDVVIGGVVVLIAIIALWKKVSD
jgi:hypothetical protein